MTVRDLDFLADENINRDVVNFLRKAGLNVFHVVEHDEMRGTPDSQLMSFAYENGWAIVTHDSDFGYLAFARKEPFHLILFVRPGHLDPNFTIESLRQLLERSIDVLPPTLLMLNRSGAKIIVKVKRGAT